MIDFNKLTLQAQNCVIEAQNISKRYQNSQITPLHLLDAALEDNTTVIHDILKELKISPENLLEDIQKELINLPKLSYGQDNNNFYPSGDFNSMYDSAVQIAETMKDSFKDS